MDLIRLIRPKHYLKNGLIFLPLFFGGKISDFDLLKNTIIGFIAFSLSASFVYIINDINDVEKDRLHPTKKNRPIASGRVSIRQAIVLAIIVIMLSMLLNALYFFSNISSWLCLVFYIVINLLYSVKGLKKVPLLDVVFLVSGFVLRLLYGSSICDIKISSWLYLVIISGAFFMGFGKRRNELVLNSGTTRDVLKFYTKDFLDKNMYSSMTLSITFFSLWCVERNGTKDGINLLFAVPILMVFLYRYSMDIECSNDGDPVNVIIKDKILLLLGSILALFLFFELYLQ